MDDPPQQDEGGRQHQKWNARYRELEAFKAEHGHCNVPQKSHGPLGAWVNDQRKASKQGRLSEERVRRLDDLGFEWSPRDGGTLLVRKQSQWDARYRQLEDFKAEHGHCNVPKSQELLGRWVEYQREAYRKSKLSEERARKLDDLGFEWSTRGPPRTWDERLEELTQYKAEHGHCHVPTRQGSLGTWANNQRTSRKNDKLSEEQIQKLDNLGFNWGTTHCATWDEFCEDLKEYKADHGHCNVPASHGPLCSWVYTQRTSRKNGKMAEERIRKLDGLGFVWSRSPQTPPPTWDERFEELKKYKADHGDCSVPWSHGSFGKWVKRQRNVRKNGKLSEERIRKLYDLGFEWSPRGNLPTWDERLEELRKYAADHGDCSVPAKHGSLGTWVGEQRAARKKNKMSTERIRKLDDLSFDWSPRSPRRTWDERLCELMAYKTEHGHCNVPQRQGSLGEWVVSQRKAYKKDKLAKERVQKLDCLDFSWGKSRANLKSPLRRSQR